MGLANERRRYYVTPSLIGWAHAQHDPWLLFASWLVADFVSLCKTIHSTSLNDKYLADMQYIFVKHNKTFPKLDLLVSTNH